MSARIQIAAAFVFLVTASPAAGQDATRSPHGELPEGLACTACHSAEAWSPLRNDLEFDHGAATGFGLDGRHEDVTCASCHEDLTFDDLGAQQDDCASCHLDVHLGTPTRPCAACHTTESFVQFPPGVVHPADFPLEGAHLQTSCESCHSDDLGGAFSPPDRECSSCHMGDYFQSLLVDHQALGFSTSCLDCHSTLDFRNVAFDHFTVSGGFELQGQHAGIECTTCHSLPDGGLPTAPTGPQDCVACHLADYQGEHGGSGFPTDCVVCHNADTWGGASFDHSAATGFDLVGNHDQLVCAACHVGSTSESLFFPSGPQDCYACHQADYNQQHSGTGFTTDCTACHQLTTWSGATFDHPFPISSGPHSGFDCAECHTVPGDFTQFTCLTCHGLNQTNNQHSGVNGYSYDSGSCLSCHENGRA